MLQNIAYIFGNGWRTDRSVFLLCGTMMLSGIGANALQLFVAPQILSKIEQGLPMTVVLQTILLFSVLLFLLQAMKVYADRCAVSVLLSTRITIIADIGRKSCETSYCNTRDTEFKRLMAAAKDATDNNHLAAENCWRTMVTLGTNVGSFLLYLLVLSNLNPYLVAFVTAASVLGFFASKRINEWEYCHREEKYTCIHRMFYVRGKAESIELGKDIRIFGLQNWLEEVYLDARRLWDAFIFRREKILIWANLIDLILDLARNGIAYVYLISMTLEHGLSAAEFLLYFSAISGFTTWVTGILKDFSTLYKECVDIGQIQEFLNFKEPFRFHGGEPIPQADSWELRMEDVSFRYPGSKQNIFEHLNLCIRPGEKLAVVGLNGAGKTTLVKLLCGFYDPDEGRILLNGTDIRQFNRQEYYQLFSAVFQSVTVLDVSLKANVAGGAENIDEKRVLDCLEKAGLRDFLAELPQGLETYLGHDVHLDGTLLSGGQTQRLMLARALYKNGPILVLDEPTAALDPIAENDIYMKYNEMTQGKTSLFISHRLASTRFCDRIILLADGKIAEEGTHEELMALNGRYSELFEIQSRYYREGGDFFEKAAE